jgi:hypothetical protein
VIEYSRQVPGSKELKAADNRCRNPGRANGSPVNFHYFAAFRSAAASLWQGSLQYFVPFRPHVKVLPQKAHFLPSVFEVSVFAAVVLDLTELLTGCSKAVVSFSLGSGVLPPVKQTVRSSCTGFPSIKVVNGEILTTYFFEWWTKVAFSGSQ